MAHKPAPVVEAPRPTTFQPYIPASQSPAEFTAKAIVLGALFGLIFGASTVYLGLRAGLTVSASIPIAVLAIGIREPTSRLSVTIERPRQLSM